MYAASCEPVVTKYGTMAMRSIMFKMSNQNLALFGLLKKRQVNCNQRNSLNQLEEIVYYITI